MNEQAKKKSKIRSRWWLKYSLRTFLLAVTVFCIWLGVLVNRANNQKRAVAWVHKQEGELYYDFQWDDSKRLIEGAEPPGPSWLRNWIGIDYFADVVYVRVSGDHDIDISPLANLANITGMKSLDLSKTAVSDVSALALMSQMESLNLGDTLVSDLAPLTGMTRLESLVLCNLTLQDLSPLTQMTALAFLDLRGMSQWDLTPLAKLDGMQIWLYENQQATIPAEFRSLVHRFGVSHQN